MRGNTMKKISQHFINSLFFYISLSFFTTFLSVAIADVFEPPPGSTLSSSRITVKWDPEPGAIAYYLGVGTTQQSISSPPWGNISVQALGLSTSADVYNIPVNGEKVYMRLWSKTLSRWFSQDYVYQTEQVIPAKINQPLTDKTIQNTSIEFNWDSGSGATEYMLAIASSLDIVSEDPWADIYWYKGTDMSVTTPGVIPLNGNDIYVRLWSKINDEWFFNDYLYHTIEAVPAEIISPEPENQIVKHAKRFDWSEGSGGTEYVLAIASDPELLNTDQLVNIFVASSTETSVVATGIPLDGNDIYVRLWSKINDEWFFNDYVYPTILSTDPPDAEEECFERGWKKISLQVGEHTRDILWRGPGNVWSMGAIMLFHGGGGSDTNWCSSEVRATHSMMMFAESAIKHGFAVFALDSTNGGFVDEWGQECGKRFDSITSTEQNIDLPFIEHVLDSTIPVHRPEGSNANVFITGLSSGGLMTIRAATHFDDKISAFAPVATLDPYGTYMFCDKTIVDRDIAPGVFLDNETNLLVSDVNACLAEEYLNELEWETAEPEQKPAFKQLHHLHDGLVDITCMEKANELLVEHGYRDYGAFVLENQDQSPLESHLWQPQYNLPILDFFRSVDSE
jgi:pimeloyl-ACP methyl ester carboxylesterase